MKSALRAAAWRLAVFVTACALGGFALVALFAQLRFDNGSIYRAEFSNVSGLESGNFVRIAGVEVGRVKHISIRDDSVVLVDFSIDRSVTLTRASRAVIRYQDLFGARFLELQEGSGEPARLKSGQTISITQTEPALDLDALVGGFRPLFRALNPDQVNDLTGQLISALQGQGATIGSFLVQLSTLTSTLADRDELIGSVIDNLGTVLSSVGGQSRQLDKAIDSVSQLMKAFAQHSGDIASGLSYLNEAGASITDLLSRGRPAIEQ